MPGHNGYWTGTYALPTGLGFNTQQVKKEDAPKSYKDLLDGKWKGGKISIDDENYELLVGLEQAWGKKPAVEYLKALAAQAPTIGRGATQRTQLLAVGEFPRRFPIRTRSSGLSLKAPRSIGSTWSRW